MARRVEPEPVGQYVVDFPTLFVAVDWIVRHCRIPDGFHRGQPFRMLDWQAWCTLNHYRVREDAEWIPENPLRGTAFYYRRSQVIALSGPPMTSSASAMIFARR